jgi:hypothetical protein
MDKSLQKCGTEENPPAGSISRRGLLEGAAKLAGLAVTMSALGEVTAQAGEGPQAGLRPPVAEAANGKPFAFFETCSRVPNATNTAFVIADKMEPVRKGYEAILAAIQQLDAPVVSTTCMGIQRENPKLSVPETVRNLRASEAAAGRLPDVAFVPVNATPEQVADALRSKYIRLERVSCPDSNEKSCLAPAPGDELRNDVFYSNQHTSQIVQGMGEHHWLVFGSGGEYCLAAAAKGLRALGMPVTILMDGCIHMAFSTPQSFVQMYERLKALGIEWSMVSDVLNQPAKSASRLASFRLG